MGDHPPADPARPWLWQTASSLAARLHAAHFRRDARTPYIAHPFRVCMTIRCLFGCQDPAVLAAAVLHDAIEDTTCDRDEITDAIREAGKRAGEPAAEASRLAELVGDLVSAMTKDMRLAETPREAEYDAQLAAADWRARLIKLADVYDNLTDTIADRCADARKATKAIDKTRRAMALAADDARDHPESARALELVRGLVEAMG